MQYNSKKEIDWKCENMLKPSIDEISISTANEFAIQLVFELAKRYSATIEQVFEVLSEMNYWRVINDTDVCCELAHDGIQATLHDIGGKFNAILSRNR